LASNDIDNLNEMVDRMISRYRELKRGYDSINAVNRSFSEQNDQLRGIVAGLKKENEQLEADKMSLIVAIDKEKAIKDAVSGRVSGLISKLKFSLSENGRNFGEGQKVENKESSDNLDVDALSKKYNSSNLEEKKQIMPVVISEKKYRAIDSDDSRIF